MENQVGKKQTWMNVGNYGRTIIDSLKVDAAPSEPSKVDVHFDVTPLVEAMHNGSLSINEEIKSGMESLRSQIDKLNTTISEKELAVDTKNLIDVGKELSISLLQAVNSLEELSKNVDLMQSVYQTKANEILSSDLNLRSEVKDSKITLKVSMLPLLICLYLMLGVLIYLAIKG